MALIQFGSFVTDVNGGIGGTIYSKNRFGTYARNKVIPVDTNSDSQRRVREDMTEMAMHWGSLTAGQRLMWTYLAEHYPRDHRGRMVRLTGFMFYSMLNRNRQEIGEALISDTPEITEPEAFDAFSVDIDTTPGTEDITLNLSPAINADNKVIVSGTSFIKKGEKYVSNDKFRKLLVIDHTFVSGGSIKNEYIAIFGGMPKTGQMVKFQIKDVVIASGYAGIPWPVSSIASI